MKLRKLLAAGAAVVAVTGLVLVGGEASAAPASAGVTSPSPNMPDVFPPSQLGASMATVIPAYACGGSQCTNLFNISVPSEGSHSIGAIHTWDLDYPLGRDSFCPNGCYDKVLRPKMDTHTAFGWPNAGGWYMAHHYRARVWIFDAVSGNFLRHLPDSNAGIWQTSSRRDEVIQVYPCSC